MDSDNPAEPAVSKTWNMAKHVGAVQAFCQAIDSLPGHAPSALLADVYDVAKSKFGFEGTINDALFVLQSASEFRLQPHELPERTRVIRTD